MTGKRILILGGYGNTGRPLAEYLLQETDAQLVIAGRRLDRAREMADHLNTKFEGHRATYGCVDASDQDSLRAAFTQVDLVVVAASTSAFVRQVATAALEAGIDYLDVQYSTQKMAVLQAMAPQIEAAGCCFITDGGFHPGLPAALIRYVAPCFDVLESANMGSVIKITKMAMCLRPCPLWPPCCRFSTARRENRGCICKPISLNPIDSCAIWPGWELR